MKFRKDINGLRAIAVIAVVLFHFNSSWVPGGFAGVDVFFVISGFLMTRIIFRGMEENDFSIIKFYIARANRIVPALAVLCFVLFVVSVLFLSSDDQNANSKHILGSLSFLSNFIYWRESGYFDAVSHEKWLLHTWSLSVEWQFYIIYPLVLVFVAKLSSIHIAKKLVLAGTALGFAFCVIATYKWPVSSYYLLPTRAWEMMVGGVAYLYPLATKKRTGKVLEILGVLLIVGAYLFISEDNYWPGCLAIIPVFGAFLLIQSQQNNSVITGNVIFQKVGLWSYSIYLWHWPLAVIAYKMKVNDYYSLVGVLLSVLLGFVSYKYVESKKAGASVVILVLGLMLISMVMYFVSGNHLSKRDYVEDRSPVSNSSYCEGLESFCSAYGSESKKDFILWGDSHSIELGRYLGAQGYSFVVYSTSGCPPIERIRRSDGLGNATVCNDKINDSVFDKIKNTKNIKNLILVGRWSLYNHGWQKNGKLQAATHFMCFDDCAGMSSEKSFENLKRGLIDTTSALDNKYNIFIFRGGPILKVNGKDYVGGADQVLSSDEHEQYNGPTNNFLETLADKKGYTIFAHDKLFFDKDGVLVVNDKDRLLFKDDNHPTFFGWEYIFSSFRENFDKSLLNDK